MSAVRVPYRAGRASGFRYGELPADVAADLERTLVARDVAGGTALKERRVYRRGPWLYKLFPARRRLRDLARANAAVRSADLHAALAPIRTPAPLVAVGLRDGAFAGPSLLVCEFVEGRSLDEVWDRDRAAVDAFARLLAAMHARGIFHGDLHPKNVLWDGASWTLIDVGSMRHPLRNLRPRALALDQWAELDRRLGSPSSMRAAFELYSAELGRPAAEAERAWARVAERSRAVSARRARADRR